mgnify:CR=1 FL=1
MRAGIKRRFGRLWPIALVVLGTAFDSYRCVADAEVLKDIELNPMCVAVLDAVGVPGLVAAKAAGLGVVISVLFEIERLRIPGWKIIWLAVGLFQAGVFAAYFR